MSFSSLNLNKSLINYLFKLGYKEPTKTQIRAIPLLLKKQSIFLNAPTGSGKTHTFLIPIFQNLKSNKLNAVIILPTLELCKQTESFVKEIGSFYPDFRYKLVLKPEDLSIKYTPNILIALQSQFQNLTKNSTFSLNKADYVVFDEVDMLIENNVLNSKIFNNKDICFIFVSTSLDENKIQKIKTLFPNIPLLDLKMEKNNNSIKHYLVDVGYKNRLETLKKFLEFKSPYFGLIFASQNSTVKDIFSYLKKEKFNVCYLSKDLNKSQRKLNLRRIEENEFQFVVLSDLGARGIDFKNVTDVISYDFPYGFSKEYYLHRAGRTGRNGNKGNSYIFYNSEELKTSSFLKTLDINATKMVFKNDDLKQKKTFERNSKTNEEMEKFINEEKSRVRISKKVKPNYKKKMRQAIEKGKGKYRRNLIQKDIRKQRVERYKSEARKNG